MGMECAGSHSHHLTAILQAGNCNLTTWQYTNWDNATHVVQPKHQHVFVQYHWFARRLGEKRALRIWEVMQVRTISQLFLSRQLQTKQPASVQIVSSCDNATHVVQPKHTHYIVCTIALGCKRLEDNHAGGMRVIMWFIPFHCYTSSRQIQRNNLPLIQTVAMQPMWCNPNINTYCLIALVCTKVWKKFMQLEYGNECRCAPSHSFIFKQAVTTKQPASMQIVSSCDNATHVVQPKHTH